MSSTYQLLLVLHIIIVVLMAAPYYNLVLVSERAAFGRGHLDVDRFFDGVIEAILFRCYFVQWSALILGVALVLASPVLDIGDVFTNWRLLVKLLAWVAIMGVHNYIYLLIQPDIVTHVAACKSEVMDPETAAKVAPLRKRRKQGAATCLFLVLVAVIMGPQILAHFPWEITAALILIAFLFTWTVYRTGARFGWA